jgi:hypothetical protein
VFHLALTAELQKNRYYGNKMELRLEYEAQNNLPV